MVMPIIAYNKDSISKSSKAVGSIEKYVTKTRAPKEQKLTAKARKELLAEAKALADADSDDSTELHLSQVTKGKPKAKSTKKSKAKDSAQAPSPSDSDKDPPVKAKKKAKKIKDVSASDDDASPAEKPKKKKKKQKAVAPADDASDDDDSVPIVKKKKKEKEKPAKKKRVRDDDDSSSSDDSPAPKRKKRRSSSTMDPTSSSTKSSAPSPFPKTFGFVTGAGKQLAIPTRPLTPPIDISDDEPTMSDHDVEMALDSTHSASSSGDEMNIHAGDVSLDKPLFLSTQSSPIAPLATKFTKFATKASTKLSVSPKRPSPNSSPTHKLTYEDFAAEVDIPVSQKRTPQYSPDWNISQLIPSTNVAGPSCLSGNHDWLLASDSDDDVLVSKSSAKPTFQTAKPTAKGKERARDSLGSHIAASPMLKRTQARSSNKQASFTEKLVTTMGPPRAVARPARPTIDADSSIELISSSTRERATASRAGPATPSRHEEDSFMDDSFAKYVQPPSAISPHSSPIRRPKGIKRGRKPAEPVLGDPLSSDEEGDADGRLPLSVLDISDDSPYVARKRKPATKVKTRKRPVFDRNNAFVEMEADLSGEDDVNVGSTDTEEDENEYDKEFIADGDITHDSGYDQSAIYRQGLMTQAPAGLNFASKPVRSGLFGPALGRTAQPAFQYSSSPPRVPNSEDDYEFGSFIVEDEDEEDA